MSVGCFIVIENFVSTMSFSYLYSDSDMESSDSDLDIYEEYQKIVDEETLVRNNIRNVVKDLEMIAQEATERLQKIHENFAEVDAACAWAKEKIKQCQQVYNRLQKYIPLGQFFTYYDMWTESTQSLTFVVGMLSYFENGQMATRKDVAETLGLKLNPYQGFHLLLEDYLLGTLSVSSELTRFAINGILKGDLSTPKKVLDFLININHEMHLLNFKTDVFRTRIDCFKFEMNRLKQVVSDLKAGKIPYPLKDDENFCVGQANCNGGTQNDEIKSSAE